MVRLIIDHCYTRDEVIPFDDESGWRCEPVPPEGDGWQIFNDRKDYKTGWRRIRLGGE